MKPAEQKPATTNRPAPKRHMSVKEPPAFQWKLIGYVDGLTVTLLKAEERSEIEAQLKRLEADSYYRNVQIYPIDAKVPPDPLAAKFARAKKAARPRTPAKQTGKKTKEKKARAATAATKKKPVKRAAKKTADRKTSAKKRGGKRAAPRKTTARASRTAGKTAKKKTAKKRK